ncbi:unnamed protein product [Brassicogethes aeneus]|uniref:Uncharacterized protein n=1 Tax=Brassicogethes aeneus TaxID=1431903 RepID=A0A9P0AWV0_BRAAE|nr:unnamed protein product [Brassicogethes aeneus]
MLKIHVKVCLALVLAVAFELEAKMSKRSFSDQSIKGYLTEIPYSTKTYKGRPYNVNFCTCGRTLNVHRHASDVLRMSICHSFGRPLDVTYGRTFNRTCWWNEVCKEEFQSQFKCKCPEWSFCRAPGRYYNAFCSMTATGYIWEQPAINGPQ